MRTNVQRVVAVLAVVALATCANLDNIDVSTSSQGTIPAATVVDKFLSSFDLPGFDSVDFSQSFKNQGVSKNDVDSVRLTSFTLTIPSPAAGQNFDFLESIAFYAETSGQPRVRIAHLDAVPRGVTSLSVAIDSGVELKPYVVAPQMSIDTEAKGARPDTETKVKADVSLDVDIHTGCE